MSEPEVRPLEGDAEIAALGEIEGWAFGFPPADAAGWFQSAGLENLRVAHLAGRLVGGLLLIPMGQWFGGRSVPMTGVAGVAVAPEARGKGVALALMRAALRELREKGVALSTLYPATLSLYRLAGYECAGTRFKIVARPRELAALDRTLSMRPATEEDWPATERAYVTLARESAGLLDRGNYIWRRVRSPRGSVARGFVFEGEHGIEGHLFVTQKSHAVGEYELRVTDAVALSARAARRILTFFADHRTLAENILWHGGPADPLVAELPEAAYTMTLGHQWMTRMVDVPRALERRGYAELESSALAFELEDELLPENSGRWLLELEHGHARVRPGGNGALKLRTRGLAPLYTGFASPFALRRAGLLDGDDATLARAAAIFAGAAPAMPDMF